MEITHTFALVCAAVTTSVSIVAIHYLPWQLMLGKGLPRLFGFILGVLAIGLPYSVLILAHSTWPCVDVLRAFWVISAAGGISALACHALDVFLRNKVQAQETSERERSMLKKVAP